MKNVIKFVHFASAFQTIFHGAKKTETSSEFYDFCPEKYIFNVI